MHSNSKEQIDQIPTHAKRRRILSELFNCFCCNFIHSLLACSDLNDRMPCILEPLVLNFKNGTFTIVMYLFLK